MLLVFFLVTSSMDSDKGIGRMLSPKDEPQQEMQDIHRSDVLQIRIDDQNALFCDEQPVTLAELQPAIVDEACRKHLMEHFAKADTFDGQECYGCPVIRQSFAALQKQNAKWNDADEIH